MPDFKKPATIIVVSCLSGGSGKTTTCLNLATMLAQRGKTLAIDLDPQGNLSQWLGWTDLSEAQLSFQGAN
jgi:chromosome partitioning protein